MSIGATFLRTIAFISQASFGLTNYINYSLIPISSQIINWDTTYS